MTELELIVLRYTAHYKNTYSGESNIRFTRANKATGITARDWEAVQASLIDDGLLRKNKSITDTGRQVIGDSSLYIV